MSFNPRHAGVYKAIQIQIQLERHSQSKSSPVQIDHWAEENKYHHLL